MSDNKPDMEQINSYLKGELDALAMHRLEKQAQSDPFLVDALEGYQAVNTPQQQNLAELRTRLENRVQADSEKGLFILWRVLPIAASLLIFLIAGWFWLLPHAPKKQPVAMALNLVLPSQKAVTNTLQVATQTSLSQHPVATKQMQDIVVTNRKPRVGNAKPVTVSTEIVSTPVPINVTGSQRDDTLRRDVAAPAPGQVQTDARMISNGLITGKITDATGQPIPGVNLKIKGTGISAITNAYGEYKIMASAMKDTLEVQMMGYTTQKIAVSNPVNLNVKLKDSEGSLDEVVIETDKPKHTLTAEPGPIGGWKSYEAYIKQNAVMPNGETGRVKLAFLVDTNGNISNIRILRGHSTAMNQRAIDIVKNGPAWEGSADDTIKKVKMRIRFRKSS